MTWQAVYDNLKAGKVEYVRLAYTGPSQTVAYRKAKADETEWYWLRGVEAIPTGLANLLTLSPDSSNDDIDAERMRSL